MTGTRANVISIIILTKNAGDGFDETLRIVYAQDCTWQFEVIIIDSGSTDETVNIARSYPARTVTIRPEEFGHGRTRNLGAGLADGQYLVFLTQDAVPTTDQWLSTLIGHFEDPSVAGVYGRHIPRKSTNPMECFFLNTRYPARLMVKQAEEGKTDMDTIFFSDVNSAIRREVWEKYPFDDRILGVEDFEWARKVLINGHKTVYEPRAAVYHSHSYTLRTVFQRYFDYGVSVGQFAAEEFALGRLSVRGLAYVGREMRFLIDSGHVKWLPYALLYNLAKFLGISLGKRQKWLPSTVKRLLSMSDYYWRSRPT